MAIIVICKRCQGKGTVKKRLLRFFPLKLKCSKCNGSGKYNISNKTNSF